MRLLLLVPIVLAAACEPPKFDCQTEAACDLVEETNGIGQHPIEGRQSRRFTVGDETFELVHIEYGAANDCPSGCFYSHYCAVVADGQEYPAGFSFNNSDEYLFDPGLYCPDFEDWGMAQFNADCQMPAFELALFSDSRFASWVNNPSDENDEFRWCRSMFERLY